MANAQNIFNQQDIIKSYPIAHSVRPCCNFGLDTIPQIIKLAKIIDKSQLAGHHFSSKKDRTGMLYTCHAGFIDISHLRDTADWAAHVYWNLKTYLNSGKEIPARKEGGSIRRSVFFPKDDTIIIDDLTENDLILIATSISYQFALFHEIATSFPIAVSVPAAFFVYEKSSAFSIEDSYSNYLGSYLGALAASKSIDLKSYNKNLTDLLNEKLLELKAVDSIQTFKAYQSVRGLWWIKSFMNNYKNLLKRDYSFENEIKPNVIENFDSCQNTQPISLLIPKKLSNHELIFGYFEARNYLNNKMLKKMEKMGIDRTYYDKNPLTQFQFRQVIDVIKKKLGN